MTLPRVIRRTTITTRNGGDDDLKELINWKYLRDESSPLDTWQEVKNIDYEVRCLGQREVGEVECWAVS